jgi:DNA-directed RNA polymerase subunit E'/Rpb7
LKILYKNILLIYINTMERQKRSIYSKCQITKTIQLPITSVGKTINITIENTIASMIENKCIVEGFVRKGSVRIITFSSGLIKGSNVIFDVVLECEVCFPVAGMLLNCICKNVTKAGIRGESDDDEKSPFVLFIARDHFYDNEYFNSIKENDKFIARVIAQRFELNDKYISIIGELAPPASSQISKSKPRLVIEDEL